MAETKQNVSFISAEVNGSRVSSSSSSSAPRSRQEDRVGRVEARPQLQRVREAEPGADTLTEARHCALQNNMRPHPLTRGERHEEQNRRPVNQSVNLEINKQYNSSVRTARVCFIVL